MAMAIPADMKVGPKINDRTQCHLVSRQYLDTNVTAVTERLHWPIGKGEF